MTLLKSIGAVFASLLVNVIFGLGTDQIFHMLNVYPQGARSGKVVSGFPSDRAPNSRGDHVYHFRPFTV